MENAKSEKRWLYAVFLEISLLGVVAFYAEIWGIAGSFVLWAGVSAVVWIVKRNRKVAEPVTMVHMGVSFLISAFFVQTHYDFLEWFDVLLPEIQLVVLVLVTVMLSVVLVMPVAFLLYEGFGKPHAAHTVLGNFRDIYVPVLVLCFMLYVYLPTETYIGNRREFEFTCMMFLPHQIFMAVLISVIAALSFSIMKKRFYDLAQALILGLDVAVYVQYMFLNGSLRLLDGESVDWGGKYAAETFTDYLVWGSFLAFSVFLLMKKEKLWNKIKTVIPALLGAVQFLTLCILLLTAPKDIYELNPEYMSSQEQFAVSSRKNVVVFILDALDNSYLKELLETEPETFAGMEDFVLYTNTCSVFDSTPTSMTQMLAGMDFAVELTGEEWYRTAWNGERAQTFYDRLHGAEYVVNGYNLASNSNRNYAGKYDNYGQYEESELAGMTVNEDNLYQGMRRLALYRALPMGMKRYAAGAEEYLADVIVMREKSYYKNEEYMQNLRLYVSEADRNYFIVEHLDGTHSPKGDVLDETKYLFTIMREYIRQLKELGVYEDTAIIITADHGVHDEVGPIVAATPAFMVKRQREHKEQLTLNRAPIYHTDMQATILDCAGLYDKAQDEGMFGQSVFDIGEDAVRERTWYDRRYDPNYPDVPLLGFDAQFWTGCNTYYGYTYTGDTEELERMVEEGRPTGIWLMTDNKG